MADNQQKQIVHYDPKKPIVVTYGIPGYIGLVDADPGVITRTGIVTRIEMNGEFETREAIYRPMVEESAAA